jgi:hypothetical protein
MSYSRKSGNILFGVMVLPTDWYSIREASTVSTPLKQMQQFFLTSTQNTAFVLLYPHEVTFTGNPPLKLIARVWD